MTQTAPLAPPPQASPPALTARRIALAVVAAATVYGDDPALALTKGKNPRHRRCLAPAISGLALATGHPVSVVCRVVGFNQTTVPTARRLGGELFTCATVAAERAVLNDLKAAPSAEPSAPPQPTPPNATPAPEPQPEAKVPAAPASVRVKPAARPKPGAVLANTVLGQQPVMSRPPARPELNRLDAAQPERRTAPSVVVDLDSRRLRRAVRMTPVTPSKLRYARRFLDARWPLEDVAFLFDVGPDALAAAVQAEAGA